MEYLIIFITCIFSGFLTGLLGVGGGIIIVPMFLTILPIFGMNFDIEHIIGISATCVFINSAICTFYRRNEKFLPLKLIFGLGFAVILGTMFGNYFSSISPEWVILYVYIGFSIISLYSLKKDIHFKLKNRFLSFLLYPFFVFIGMLSAMIGMGGAVFFTTTLKSFTPFDTKKLLPTIGLLVLINACATFLGKITIGAITFTIIPIAFLASIIGVKLGVILSKKLSCDTLNNLLVLVMILGLIRIILRLIVG